MARAPSPLRQGRGGLATPTVAQPGTVPARVRSAAAARNGKGPAKRSFRGVCPRVFEILVASCFVLVVGCDMGDGNYTEHSDVHNEETVDLRRDGAAVIDERQREAITITDVVLRESEGGWSREGCGGSATDTVDVIRSVEF